jgi:flagellar biosynthetic protein FlhB
MSDHSEKPFEATPARIAKAIREGDVARSSELGANLAFACAACALAAIAPSIGAYARAAIAAAAAGRVPAAASLASFALALVPVLAGAIGVMACNVLQSGGLRVAAVTAKFERLDPIEGIKRILSRETLGRTMRAAAAFALAALAMIPAFKGAAMGMLGASSPPAVAAAAWAAIERVVLAACATGFLFALAEYASVRRGWLRKLRMSFEERKREAKEQDGDPFARGRRRTLHRALLRGALRDVKDAAFVVANPTHVAVALAYRPPEIPVPRVTVRAAGALALRVRALAARHGIPIVENVALARALFADSLVGRPIPRAHYVAVAEIVTALGRMVA